MGSQLYLRVNGIDITNLKIRRKMVSGAPIGEKELVIEDPTLGKFSIDDSFAIEVSTDHRTKWKTVSVGDFLALLDTFPQETSKTDDY